MAPTTITPLSASDGPLVWIDCEMTGLDHKNDRIIEIAVLITNGNLDIVDPSGFERVIRTEKSVLDGMNEWCVNQHGISGLTQACIDSPHSYEKVYRSVLDYVKKWIPEKGVGVLAGSTVHMDRMFLIEGMPDLVDHLHYRIVDVSSIKELCKRWYPETSARERMDRKESNHRALDDIRASIAELQFYRENIFQDASGTQ